MGRACRLLLACAALLAGGAQAQIYTGLDHINRIVRSTPGLTSVAIGQSTSAAIQATGPINFASASNMHLNIPLTVEATASRYAVAQAAGKILARAVPFVGVALLAKEIYDLVNPAGIVQCSANSYEPCQQALTVPTPPAAPAPFPAAPIYYRDANGVITAYLEVPSVAHGCGGSYPAGFVLTAYRQTSASACGFVAQGRINNYTLPPPTPTTADALTNAATNKIQDGSEAKKLYDMIADLIRGNPMIGTVGTDPLDIKAMPLKLVNSPPVVGTEVVTSTQKVTNPDGTTSTIVRKEQTTVTPTMDPSATVGDPRITFPSKTKVTTTTTNDTTGATKVDTDDQNFDSPDSPKPLEIPTDYAREPTLQRIEQSLSTEGAPVLPDQTAVVTTAASKADTDIAKQRTDAQTAQETDKSRWFSWLWTPPVGSCAPYPGAWRGITWTWDLCPQINNIKLALGWLLALFSSLTIYGVLFRKGS